MLLDYRYATRWPMRLALLTLLVLLGLAWHFYLERSAYYDLAYHLFLYLKNDALAVQNRRFVAIATQLPTLLAIRAGWSLDAVLRLYSVVFILYYLAVFLACAYWLRNEAVALVVALLFVLLAARTFYWAQSELPQALVALLLFYAGVARQVPVRWRWSTLALAALVPVFVFGHPLCILPFAFLWAYDWLLNRRYRDWGYYGLLALALVVAGLRAALIPAGSYEDTRMTFKPNLLKYFPNYLLTESFHNFWHLCATDLLALPLLLLALTVFYLWRQRRGDQLAWARLALVWAFVAGYVFVVNVSNPGYTEATYLENLYLPLTIFVAVPLAVELLPVLERHWPRQGPLLVAGALAVGLTLRLGVVWYRHAPYTAYQRWLGGLLAYTRQFPERKFLLWPDNVDPHRLRAGWPWWALASETMLRSARPSPDSVQTLRTDWNLDDLANAGSKPGVLLGPFEELNTNALPSRYFRFPRGLTYRVLNTQPPQEPGALDAYITAHQGVQLALSQPLPATLPAGHDRTVAVRVQVPAAARPLHAGIRCPHPTLLRTAFYQTHEWPADTPPVQAPLEVDVYQPWTQTLLLRTPTKPGHYTFEVSLLSDNYRDWPVRLRVPVEVQ